MEVEPNAWYPCVRISPNDANLRGRYMRMTERGFENTATAIEWFIHAGILTKDAEGEIQGGWGDPYFICAGYKTHGRYQTHLALIQEDNI